MEISFYSRWLKNGRTYNDAVDMYAKYGTNATLKILFAQGETSYTRTKIAFEIKALGNITEAKITAAAIPFKTYHEPKKRIDPDTLPESLKVDYFNLGPIWSKVRYLHSQLANLQSDETRCEHALEIIDLSAKRREIFNKIDYFQEHGKEMPQLQKPQKQIVPVVANETAEIKNYRLKEELQRLRVQRSKMLKQPNRQTKLNDVIVRINEIGKELNNGQE